MCADHHEPWKSFLSFYRLPRSSKREASVSRLQGQEGARRATTYFFFEKVLSKRYDNLTHRPMFSPQINQPSSTFLNHPTKQPAKVEKEQLINQPTSQSIISQPIANPPVLAREKPGRPEQLPWTSVAFRAVPVAPATRVMRSWRSFGRGWPRTRGGSRGGRKTGR